MNPYLIADISETVSPAVVFISVEWPPVERSANPLPVIRFPAVLW